MTNLFKYFLPSKDRIMNDKNPLPNWVVIIIVIFILLTLTMQDTLLDAVGQKFFDQ